MSTHKKLLHGSTPTELVPGLLESTGGDIVCQPPGKKPKKLLVEEKPLNYQRALWLNHEAVTEGRKNKAETLRVAAEEKRLVLERNATEHKQNKLDEEKKKVDRVVAKQEREAKKEEAQRTREEKNKNTAVPARTEKETRCANPVCPALWTEDFKGWLGCDRRPKQCALWFCSTTACQKQLRAHENLCVNF